MTEIQIHTTQNLKPLPDSSKLGFGQYFSDHMFVAQYSEERGWYEAEVIPYSNFSIDPGAAVFHYGQALFEGMKAFVSDREDILLFRPEYNWKRMAEGAERLCMQAPPYEIFMEGLKALLKVDKRWIPKEPGCALYLRPTLIGSEAFLGVRPSKKYIFYILLSPVGAYYSEGVKPVKIWVETEYIRAAPGGLGATKAGANYAASLKTAHEVKKQGYAQVLWLDVNHKFIEEVGTMNIFFVFKDEVVTPKLNGSILAGGVRDSVITLLKNSGVNIVERDISMDEIVERHASGDLRESFGTGTAAVISPIGDLAYKGKNLIINNNQMGELSSRLLNELSAMQRGQKYEPWGWVVKI